MVSRVVAPTVDLRVTKTDSPDPVGVSEVVTYTITVTNFGPDDASDVVLNDVIDSTRAE